MLSVFKALLQSIPPASSLAPPTATRVAKRAHFEEDGTTASAGGSCDDLFGEGHEFAASEEDEREWAIPWQREAHDTLDAWLQEDANDLPPIADVVFLFGSESEEVADEGDFHNAESGRGTEPARGENGELVADVPCTSH